MRRRRRARSTSRAERATVRAAPRRAGRTAPRRWRGAPPMRSSRARPLGVRLTSTERRSLGSGSRRARPASSSRSTIEVADRATISSRVARSPMRNAPSALPMTRSTRACANVRPNGASSLAVPRRMRQNARVNCSATCETASLSMRLSMRLPRDASFVRFALIESHDIYLPRMRREASRPTDDRAWRRGGSERLRTASPALPSHDDDPDGRDAHAGYSGRTHSERERPRPGAGWALVRCAPCGGRDDGRARGCRGEPPGSCLRNGRRGRGACGRDRRRRDGAGRRG